MKDGKEMKSVLLSIKPKWCEYIASGKKTVEVRKTKPKLKTPFKVYIYCTKGKFEPHEHLRNNLHYDDSTIKVCEGQGKIIGEFVCNKIEDLRYDALEMTYFSRKYRDAKLLDEEFFPGTQVTYQEAYDYCKGMSYGEEDSDLFYGWHITDLLIYDKPKELYEFKTKCKEYGSDNPNCTECDYYISGMCYEYDESDCGCNGLKPVTRPPQSWMYCLEYEEEAH